MTQTTAVIVDIVRSRELTDRRTAQRQLETAFALVNESGHATQPFAASVGDELQALFPSAPHALRAVLLVRLALPPALDCRFGMGSGVVRTVGTGLTAPLQDGSAWWLARDAIDEVHRRESSRTPSLHTWYLADPETAEPSDLPEGIVNAYLLARDHLVSEMSDRARRLSLGLLLGRNQSALAREEGITQGAVSQSLQRSGASTLLAGLAAIGLSASDAAYKR